MRLLLLALVVEGAALLVLLADARRLALSALATWEAARWETGQRRQSPQRARVPAQPPTRAA